MTGVRVLVGTRKGAFVLAADGPRRDRQVSGPHIAGWEMYHLNGSPAEPKRVYASQSSGWFGQLFQRSNDGGETWEPVGNESTYRGTPGTHQWYDGTPHLWRFARVWHLEPSHSDPDTFDAYIARCHARAGVERWGSVAERSSASAPPSRLSRAAFTRR